MAEVYAFCSPSHSQPSSPPGDRVKDAYEDEQFRETELFEDTLVIKSPFDETQVEDLNLDTELVEDSEPAENMISGPICEHDQEVVLDSEDEEMDTNEAVNVAKGLLEDGTSPVVKIPSMRFQKRQPKLPCEQAGSNTTTFGKFVTEHHMPEGDNGASIHAESFNDNNQLCLPTRLNYTHSTGCGDSTQAALGFVDQYLSSNNVEMFQGIHYSKATRDKSPHVPSARGPLSLARRIKARSQNDEEPFIWVYSDQNDKGTGIFHNNIEAASNFKSYRQTYMRRRQEKGGCLQNQGNCGTGNIWDETLVEGPGMETKNNNFITELDVQSSATREDIDAYSSVAHTEDMFDIGFDTEVAAEAMEALAYVSPTGCHFKDAHQPVNVLDGSFSDLTENEAHLKNSSYRQNSGLRSITIKSKKRNVSSCSPTMVTSNSSCKHTGNQELNPVIGKMKSKLTVEGRFEHNTRSPRDSDRVSREEVCPQGDDVSFQPAPKEPKKWNNEGRWTRIKDQPSHHTEGNNNVEEEGIIKHERKGNSLVADPLKLGVRTKRLKLPTNLCGVARESRLKHQVQVSPRQSATSSFLRIDSWPYPKRPRGKRKRANVQINLHASTILCIDGKESSLHSTRSLKGQDDVDKSCFPHTRPLCKASRIENDRCLLQGNSVQPASAGGAMEFENLHDMHPLLLAHVEISSNKSIAPSSSKIPATVASTEGIKISNANHTYNEHHKTPCNKNLPKSSLLKELIRLGVSEFTSDLTWKDLRHRRDMTYVRVLFSQHLDESVIKQQKKILARLNISTASSSMEASHFVADKFARTKNMLETMALGKLVVTHLWLESCAQANCFIDEKNYILRDMKKEKEIGFSMPVSLARARQKPLLKGKRVYITPHVKPDKKVVTSLVTAVHGQIVDDSQICAYKNDKSLDDLLILSCEDDYAICHHFLKRGTAVYSSELLLNGIVIQKLELERHQLFMDQVKRNSPSPFNRFGKVYRRRRDLYLDHS